MTSSLNRSFFPLALLLATNIGINAFSQSLRVVPSDRIEQLHTRVGLALDELEHIDPVQANELAEAFSKVLEGENLPSRATMAVQQLLDSACLLEVAINPESRVKVSAGPAARDLVTGQWRAYLVKVHNQAAVTAPLRVSTPQRSQPQTTDRDAWLEIQMVDGESLREELSGDLIEYRVIRLRTHEQGDRAALIAMDVGQGTADIGFRNDTMLLFHCERPEAAETTDENQLEDRLLQLLPPTDASEGLTRLVGMVVDQESNSPIPARVYLSNERGEYFHVHSTDDGAVPYRKTPRELPTSHEVHTAVTGAAFYADLEPGRYRIAVERGNEYIGSTSEFTLREENRSVVIGLKRMSDIASQGWYSGDVHVHRKIEDLPIAMLADDLNVAFAINDWVEDSSATPSEDPSKFPPRIKSIDSSHVISLRNTEYEVISVSGNKAVLGSLIVLDHHLPLRAPALPLSPLGREVVRTGGLLDLDKHTWPWSLAAAPLLRVDLFELANNHLWRTGFGFHEFGADTAADYMRLSRTGKGLTEEGWIHYGFEAYYALLNCGLEMKVSAGSASGVHPTPLGHGRVYARVDGPFDFDQWRDSLASGRSFVSTGPLLSVRFNGADPGTHFIAPPSPSEHLVRVEASATSLSPVERIEVLCNGRVIEAFTPENHPYNGGFRCHVQTPVATRGSAWCAVRAFSRNNEGRLLFAHTNPVYIKDPTTPLRPRREQVDWIVRRLRRAVGNHQRLLDPQTLREFHDAIEFYQSLAEKDRLVHRAEIE